MLTPLRGSSMQGSGTLDALMSPATPTSSLGAYTPMSTSPPSALYSVGAPHSKLGMYGGSGLSLGSGLGGDHVGHTDGDPLDSMLMFGAYQRSQVRLDVG